MGFTSALSDVLSAVAYAIFLVVCLVLFVYRDRSVGSSPNSGIPGPRGYPLIGNLLEVLSHKHDFLGWLSEMEDRYGPLFTYTMPIYGRGIVVTRPEWIEHMKKRDLVRYGKSEHILTVFREFLGHRNTLALEGEEWRAGRKLLAPLFSIHNFDKQVTYAMRTVLPVVLDLLENVAAGEVVLDWNNFVGRLAATVFFHVAFDTNPQALDRDVQCLSKPNALLDNMRVCNNISASRLYNPFFHRTEKKDGKDKEFAQAQLNLRRLADNVIDARLAQHEQGITDDNDFLTSLLATGEDRSYLRESIISLFFGGQDNITNALGWSLYELSRNPNWLQRMRNEAKEKNQSGGVIGYDEVSSYPVHLAVFYETLRLWPGVPKNSRKAKDDDLLPAIPSLGIGPVKVHKGDNITWSDFSMMKRTDVWGDNARSFDPGRHLNQNGQFVKPSTPRFHSFGAGPRLCPGSQLATYEFVAIWAALLPIFEITPVEMVERRMLDGLTSTMEGPFLVRIRHL